MDWQNSKQRHSFTFVDCAVAMHTVCAPALKRLNKAVSDFANQSSSAILLNP